MILSDVNVLLHIFRDDSPKHRGCREWFRGIMEGDAAFGMSPQALSSLIRIVTNPKVFDEPSQLRNVLEFSEALLNHPNCIAITPGERHWGIFTRLCMETEARGNLVPDAWFAALAIESGCEWITFDRDFARFSGLRWRSPY